MASREFCRCFLRNYLTGLYLKSWKPRSYGKRKRKWKQQLRTFNMFSSLIHRGAISVILTSSWVLEDLSVALNLHLWKNKFTLKIRNILISHPTRSALHRRYTPHCIHHFLTDSSEQLQSFLKIQNIRTVRSNQVSVIFILLATKRSFKTLFSFKSNKKDHFQMPASYPGEGLLRKTQVMLVDINSHFVIPWRTSHIDMP